MSEISYKELKDYVKKLKKDRKLHDNASVYLIYGEELLYRAAFETLLDALIPLKNRDLNYDPMDGTEGNVKEAIERANTYSLIPGVKVVAILDSRIFYSKQDEQRLLEKAKEAFDGENIEKSAKYLLNLLGILNLSLNDIQDTRRSKTLKLDPAKHGDAEWLDAVIRHCEENHLKVPSETDDAGLLENAIEKGFPGGNHLVITADVVDKRRRLFKIIQKNGVIINCFVPKGDRRADKIAQEAVLGETMKARLDQSGKTMDQRAYRKMYEFTGFDLATFSGNLEKLISYVGDRKKITIEDVESVLKRSKKDPIYELTNSISDRNVGESIFFLNSLLSDNLHPLQILAAITNQIRKILLAKGFAESSHSDSWHAGIPYGQFKNKVLPAIQTYDRELLSRFEEWDKMLLKDVNRDHEHKEKKRTKKTGNTITDLVVVKNPKNPYPVYQMLLKSEKFSTRELLDAMEHLSQTDVKLKSTRQAPKIILEEAIFKICRKS
jgi:DNA polymerase III subunit delta